MTEFCLPEAPRSRRPSPWLSAFAVTTALYAITVGVATLFGWYFQIPRLLDWTGAGITQKTNNAIGMVFVGLAIAWLSLRPADRIVPRLLSCVAGAIGALTLFEHITQINLAIDTLLFDEAPGQPGTSAPNRMGPIASTWFVLSCAALCLTTGRALHRRVATSLAVVGLALTAIPLVGYLYGADFFFTIPRLTAIAFQTTTVFLFLSLAQMALVPEHGLIAALRRDDAGGLVMRRLVLPLTLLPLLLGAVILVGLDAKLYDERFAMAALVFALTVGLLSIAGYAMSQVSRVTAALTAQQRLYKTLTDNATTALFITDDQHQCVFMNPAAVEITGFTLDETRGRRLHDLIHHTRPDGRPYPLSECPIDRALPSRSRIRGEEVFVHKEGWFYHVEFAASPLVDEHNQALCTIIEVADITERKAAEQALRTSEQRLRLILANENITAFTTDRELRYTWVANPHPAFRSENVVGKRDEELIGEHAARRAIALKQTALESGRAQRGELEIEFRDGTRAYDTIIEPTRDESGCIIGTCGVAMDVTDRRRAMEALERGEAALRDMDQRKDVFLATLAHELRNPLTAIHHGVQLLGMGNELSPQKKNVVAIVAEQVRHLVHLVDDLLDISRITRGKITLRRTDVDLATVVRRAADAVQALMHSHNHTLTLEIADTPITVNADGTRLVQVLTNLLNNAAKFTNDGGKIAVNVERRDGEAVIRVRDNGRGIESDALGSIFDIFYQTDRNLDRSAGGLGIGLALVKNLVELHGGRVEAQSDGLGRGSEFVVRLPCA